MIKRRKTRTINIGGVKIGSGHPIAVQSMTKTDTCDVRATLDQIRSLEKRGCEIVRLAVKDMASARAFGRIKERVNVPLVADIHFDHNLALECIKQKADKIRINPGNIAKKEHIYRIIEAAAERKIPVRIGVNSGSLEKGARGRSLADKMAASALTYCGMFEKKGFKDIVISLKASDVTTTVMAYRKVALECDYPLHLGVTASGPAEQGVVKSSIGIGSLLVDGIGDTVRVSLTGKPEDEVIAAREILSASGARNFGPEIISCPTCGRCRVDLVSIVDELDKKIGDLLTSEKCPTGRPFTIAVMGCEVNGPGEARSADMGVAFGRGKGAIFKKGRVIRTVSSGIAVGELVKCFRKFYL